MKVMDRDPRKRGGKPLRALDERFIAPALTQLRRGHLERVTLIANDHALQLHRRSALKVWRRARAGLESFA